MKAAEEMKREQKEVKLRMILQDYHRRNNYELQQAVNDILALDALPPAEGATDKFRDVLNEVQRYIETNGGATESEMKAIWNSLSCAITSSEKRQPTAEGAEEIIESILESLGDPINIHNHAFEIRPYTVDHKTEWWIFHKEVGSGEPLKQWLGNFATLHDLIR